MLIEALNQLGSKEVLASVNSEVLFERLIKYQNFVEDIEQSSTSRISWPIVRYCDTIWNKLFSNDKKVIFYTLTKEHNYLIYQFSRELRKTLTGLLTQKQIDSILGEKDIYCLRLASLEEENLTLYAIIAHEFGHVIYRDMEDTLNEIYLNIFKEITQRIDDEIIKLGKAFATRRRMRVRYILKGFIEEITSDIFATLLMGPAFYISLDEMSWSYDRNQWIVGLSYSKDRISAYPSFNFRLSNVYIAGKIEEVMSEIFKSNENLNKVKVYFGDGDINNTFNKLEVIPNYDEDAVALENILYPLRNALEEHLIEYVSKCKDKLKEKYKEILINIDPRSISDLILRLKNKIIPNIVKDSENPLLGTPADLQHIILSSALYRMQILLSGEIEEIYNVLGDSNRIERLASKAVEVTFVQREYNDWLEREYS